MYWAQQCEKAWANQHWRVCHKTTKSEPSQRRVNTFCIRKEGSNKKEARGIEQAHSPSVSTRKSGRRFINRLTSEGNYQPPPATEMCHRSDESEHPHAIHPWKAADQKPQPNSRQQSNSGIYELKHPSLSQHAQIQTGWPQTLWCAKPSRAANYHGSSLWDFSYSTSIHNSPADKKDVAAKWRESSRTKIWVFLSIEPVSHAKHDAEPQDIRAEWSRNQTDK